MENIQTDTEQTETPCTCHEQQHGSRLVTAVTIIIVALVIAALVKFLFK